MNNDDLISREALIQELQSAKYIIYANDSISVLRNHEIDRCISFVETAPTVDTTCPNCDSGYAQGYSDGYLKGKEERPTGEWYYNYLNGWHCSICHESVKDMPTVMDKANFAFCPNCGAKMKKEANND